MLPVSLGDRTGYFPLRDGHRLVLPIQDHLSFRWIGDDDLLEKPHLLTQSMQLPWMNSAPQQGWSYDSSLANQRAHSSGHGDWFRSGPVSKPDPTSQNIGTNIGNTGFELGECRHGATADVLLENENNTGVTESRAGVRRGP